MFLAALAIRAQPLGVSRSLRRSMAVLFAFLIKLMMFKVTTGMDRQLDARSDVLRGETSAAAAAEGHTSWSGDQWRGWDDESEWEEGGWKQYDDTKRQDPHRS